jgi:hypothetical protein
VRPTRAGVDSVRDEDPRVDVRSVDEVEVSDVEDEKGRTGEDEDVLQNRP